VRRPRGTVCNSRLFNAAHGDGSAESSIQKSLAQANAGCLSVELQGRIAHFQEDVRCVPIDKRVDICQAAAATTLFDTLLKQACEPSMNMFPSTPTEVSQF
jgi:hypothetical protein